MTLKKSTWVIFFSLVSWLLPNAAGACPKTNCIRIGTWNLEWLGSEMRTLPADKNTIHSMANLIANELSIDVIALEEINTELDGKVHGENFNLKPWQDLQLELEKQGYETKAGSSGYAQHIVLAWRAPVASLQIPGDLSVPDHYEFQAFCHSSNLRKPLAGLFRANQFEFWVVGLHLKANTNDIRCATSVRTKQIADLSVALKPLAKRDTDIILIGDFNSTSHNKSLQRLSAAGFQTLDDLERRNANSNKHSYHSHKSESDKSGSLIDHVMINTASIGHWQPRSTTVYTPQDPQDFASVFSDHRPLWADFYTQKNND